MTLDAQHVSVTRGGRRILDDVALTARRGELLCLLGPNGSGKSTLLNVVAGLLRPDAGDIRLDDQPLFAVPANVRARALAYLPQERSIEWRLSVRDIVMLGRYPHRNGLAPPSQADWHAVERAIALADISDLVDRAVDTLSGGERTRVLLARVLAVEAPLLLADEPLAALDPYHQDQVMQALSGLARQGAAVIVVVHDLALAARYADRITLLNAGRVAADGKPTDTLDAATLHAVYRIDSLASLRDQQGDLRFGASK